MIELRDGRVLMFMRTQLGQLYKSFSSDGGRRWSVPEPTGLAAALAPCRLRRIPKTGDLICIWNQASADEIRRGLYRCRLSVAISRDDGETWQYFKTLDCGGLPPAGRIEPAEPQLLRGAKDVGRIPDDYRMIDYPNVGFHEDAVLISYQWNHQTGKTKLLLLPLEWFYH